MGGTTDYSGFTRQDLRDIVLIVASFVGVAVLTVFLCRLAWDLAGSILA